MVLLGQMVIKNGHLIEVFNRGSTVNEYNNKPSY